jgi:hypothetical protein
MAYLDATTFAKPDSRGLDPGIHAPPFAQASIIGTCGTPWMAAGSSPAMTVNWDARIRLEDEMQAS